MQAPKNGFFYVIDRATGELISADKYQDNVNWATSVDLKTGRPVEAPNARYEDARPRCRSRARSAATTGIRWRSAPTRASSTSRRTRCRPSTPTWQNFRYRPGFWNTGTDFAAAALPTKMAERIAAGAASKGQLVAWDPVAKKARWTVDYPNAWNGGVLATGGGLVFQGALDGKFRAYDAAKGGDGAVGSSIRNTRRSPARSPTRSMASNTSPSPQAGAPRSRSPAAGQPRCAARVGIARHGPRARLQDRRQGRA